MARRRGRSMRSFRKGVNNNHWSAAVFGDQVTPDSLVEFPLLVEADYAGNTGASSGRILLLRTIVHWWMAPLNNQNTSFNDGNWGVGCPGTDDEESAWNPGSTSALTEQRWIHTGVWAWQRVFPNDPPGTVNTQIWTHEVDSRQMVKLRAGTGFSGVSLFVHSSSDSGDNTLIRGHARILIRGDIS